MKFQHKLAAKRHFGASRLYSSLYDNIVYQIATAGKSNEYANALINEALALCGDPYCKISNRNWSIEAQDFLQLFV